MGIRAPRKRWFVNMAREDMSIPASVDPAVRRRLEAMTRIAPDRPLPVTAHGLPCWTFSGAQRKASRYNSLRRMARRSGVWEVFGPLGKDDD